MKSLAPVALFAYNRADHLEQTVQHLLANDLADQTALCLFSDAAKNPGAEQGVEQVRQFARSIRGFGSISIVEREKNWGLLRSMICGVGEIARKDGRVIVLEDDIITAPCFLRFMNDALAFYEDYHVVGSISGYTAPMVSDKLGAQPGSTFFHYLANCWGWGTWWDRWGKANWEPQDWKAHLYGRETRQILARGGSDLLYMMERSFTGQNQSWMARWYYHCMMHGMLTLYPAQSLTGNIGFDGTGTHYSKAKNSVFDRYRTRVDVELPAAHRFCLPVSVDERAHMLMKRFWDAPWYMESKVGQIMLSCYRAIKRRVKGART